MFISLEHCNQIKTAAQDTLEQVFGSENVYLHVHISNHSVVIPNIRALQSMAMQLTSVMGNMLNYIYTARETTASSLPHMYSWLCFPLA